MTANPFSPPEWRCHAVLIADWKPTRVSCCPFFVPVASKNLVILVSVVVGESVSFPNDYRKLLIRRVRGRSPDRVCKTSIPGSNPGGASNLS